MIASRLSKTKAAPSVLLLEAGGTSTDPSLGYIAQRYAAFLQPELNWGYKTTPQAVKNGEPVDFSRGKGLGGSTVVNFSCYTVGPKDDYDEWARLVGDDYYNWDNALERRKRFETYNPPAHENELKYSDPDGSAHGHDGPVIVEYPTMEDDVAGTMDSMIAAGLKLNKDLNSGDPIGAGIVPNTASKAHRTTAAGAYLKNPPKNLEILTNSQVTKIVFDDNKATGVVANDKICK